MFHQDSFAEIKIGGEQIKNIWKTKNEDWNGKIPHLCT